MSLTRNPWHIREYTAAELTALVAQVFKSVEMKGVYGNDKVMEYHEKNRVSVRRITRFDIFNLQYRLPRRLLQIPYDLLNRLNRRSLLGENASLVNQVTVSDFSIGDSSDSAFDLFVIAEK